MSTSLPCTSFQICGTPAQPSGVFSDLAACSPRDELTNELPHLGEDSLPPVDGSPETKTPIGMVHSGSLRDPFGRDGEDYSTEDSTIGTTPMRFVVLAFFSMFGFVNQVQYVSYAFIVDEASDYYNISNMDVNLLSLLVPIVYCIAVLPGCSLYNLIGLRYGLMAGSGVNLLGSLIKLASVWLPHYPLLVIAQLSVGLGQVMYQSLPTRIASTWFPAAERALATAIASLLGFAGMAVGMFYSPQVVYLPDACGKSAWLELFAPQVFFAAVAFCAICVSVKDKPKLKPSATANEGYRFPNLWPKVVMQLKQRNLILLYLSFGIGAGLLTGLASVLTQILQPFDISEDRAGILAFSGILAGAANCGLVGYILDQCRMYRKTSLLLFFLVVLLLTPLAALTKLHSFISPEAFRVVVYIVIPLVECIFLPIVPTVMELSVELTYPEPEIVSTTLVLMSMCFFSFVGMVVFSIILGDTPTENSSFAVLVVVLVASMAAFVGLFFVQEDLRRQKEELQAANTVRSEEEGDYSELPQCSQEPTE